MKFLKKYWPLLLVMVASLPAIWALFLPGFIATDDGGWMVIRFSSFYQDLLSGQFPARFLTRLNFGYGYPVANFLYPGFMYLAVPVKILGFNFVEAIKIIAGLSFIAGAIFCYLWLKRLFDEVSSIAGTIFYTYAPYHVFDLYKRGSIGELISIAMVPFILWQIERRNVPLIGVGIGFLIISHNSLAIIFAGFIALYMGLLVYVSKKRKELYKDYIKSVILGMGLSAFFWMPAVFELSNTVFSKTNISNFSEYFADFWLIGISTLSISGASAAIFALGKAKIKEHSLTLLMLVTLLISVIFASSISEMLWRVLPVGFVQFPFRVLSVAIISGAFLTAFFTSIFSGRIRIIVSVILTMIIVASSYQFFIPKMENYEDGYYSTNEGTTTVKDEYMPKWVRQKPSVRASEKVRVVRGSGDVSNVVDAASKISFDFSSNNPAVLQIATIYYPGWRAFSNGEEKALFHDNKGGLIELKVNSGNQKINLKFGETPLRIIADVISVLTGLVIVYILTHGVRKTKKT